ncbi:histidine--tRNA ligase [Carboxylicivirga mesophila]|uniref:Histidine--tRNA ligase n=1 Tax=Carboxylicivirga mesophila TaxID=1166478 RepID=A0ABS5KAK5_9BACT|nr:histidine--tRNA ligase [Carboxylicivirga mesophila]MBS2211538.1 histidine--tRNA ligase [Carboxylicivirga mesophila]
MAQKPSIPKGTRDFSPVEMVKRNYIFDTVKSVFQKYGYLPIETPAMENLSTLLGKYGEEGDKLLFKILNSGDYLKKADDGLLAEKASNKVMSQISEKGLRYDLTVPFARFVVQHQNEISFPFKRYQIQPVWRADRPQKGRYREFFQCDVDVVGSNSLLNEVELIQIVDEVYRLLNINVVLKLNNRKILSGIAEIIDASDKIVDITVAIDKLDKIGLDKVNEELASKGLSAEAIDTIQPIIMLSGTNREKVAKLREVLASSEIGLKGVDELEVVLNYLDVLKLDLEVELDLTLARGLNYYTGAIFEVKARDVAIGSITGGGRYDDLTGIFGLKDVSGVGISFGADRIYDVMNQLELFPKADGAKTRAMFVNFGGEDELYALQILNEVRKAGINAELFPDAVKMKKQMNYANKKEIPFVLLAGEEERKANTVTVKNMESGEQSQLTVDELIKVISI